MCGINGIFRFGAAAPPIDSIEVERTREAQARRGPDGAGVWLAPDGMVALGHRRLAILDLSDAGAQPMASADGRYRIVYNGEIYNFRELRRELEAEGAAFRTDSDTEVILALWSRLGTGALPRLRGMYALAIWDGAERTLTLARDPFGIKPLYYSVQGGLLRFASQVRGLESSGALSRDVDPAALVGYLLWGSVPEPWTIRSAIRALPAGHLLVAGPAGVEAPSPAPPCDAGSSAEDSVAAIEASVRAHLVSDVPVALFLSAGLDSAMVAALAVRHLPEPPTTLTVAFEGWEGTDRDEAPLARAVAGRLGTRHVERRLGRAEVAALWPQALAAMDQPSIDGFNTFVVARAAAEAGIKVALSGLGGDELLGSYPSFRDVPRWTELARALGGLPGARAAWEAVCRPLAKRRPKARGLLRYGASLAGAYFLRRGLFLPEELPRLIGRERAETGLAELDPVSHASAALNRPGPVSCGGVRVDSWSAVQRLEVALYLRNQLLRDSDWAAMASSVELRVPFVDVPLWRALARAGFEPARSQGKAAQARAVAERLGLALPEALWTRSKTGFAVPVAEWVLPPGPNEVDSAGRGSRRLAVRLLEELGLL